MSVRSKSFLSVLILISYLIFAGGSFSEEVITFNIIILVVGSIIAFIFFSINDKKMQNQREIIKEKFPNCKVLIDNGHNMTLYSLPNSNDVLFSVITNKDNNYVVLKNIIPSYFEMVKNYQYIADDVHEKVYIIKYDNNNFKTQSFNYKDIISIEIVENGITTYKKSTTRTVGGALAGGVLFGGAGAVVGGLSGSTTSSDKISKYEVKFLVRAVNNPTYILSLFESSFKVPTIPKDEWFYKNISVKANNIKDSVNVIIDKVDIQSKNNVEKQYISNNVVDELTKLSQLHDSGNITDSEYKMLKKNILTNNEKRLNS
jgi:hypothetical protein